MRKLQTVFGAILLAAAVAWSPGTASAASVDEVVRACDRMDGAQPGSCGYSINEQGDISGCSQNACFYCPADGSRQCVGATAERRTGKGGNLRGSALLNTMTASPEAKSETAPERGQRQVPRQQLEEQQQPPRQQPPKQQPPKQQPPKQQPPRRHPDHHPPH